MTRRPAINNCSDPSARELAFRPLGEPDIDAYCALFKDVFASPPWNEKLTLKKIKRGIKSLMRKRGFLGVVALTGREPIGFIAGARIGILPKAFYLAQLFVNGAMQGRGVGNRLLRELTGLAGEAGASRILLLTKPGSKAEEFYRRYGFRRWLPFLRIRGKGFFSLDLKRGQSVK
jgi:aminoglycoside 6'-N-acetyltransferase I